MPSVAEIAARYRFFSEAEAMVTSRLYGEVSLAIADDPDLLAVIATLPEEKQQPNLVLTATRFITGGFDDYGAFREGLFRQRDEIIATIMARRTQTNEVGRCSALYAVLATLPQPIALLEVGASAGLRLVLDRYRYDLSGTVTGDLTSPLTIPTTVTGTGPPLANKVEIAWRAGIDLNPIDLGQPGEVAWLQALIWPGEEERAGRLRTALDIARRDPPRVVGGDLNTLLPELAAEAPRDATLVVCNSSVLGYLTPGDCGRFVDQVADLPGHWISQEIPSTLPWMALPEPPPQGRFSVVVALDGTALGYSHPHGSWIHWF